MSKRYSIMVVEHGSKREVELCQVDNDPHGLAKAAAEKTLRIAAGNGRLHYIPKYDSVRVIDHAPAFAPAELRRVEGDAPDRE